MLLLGFTDKNGNGATGQCNLVSIWSGKLRIGPPFGPIDVVGRGWIEGVLVMWRGVAKEI